MTRCLFVSATRVGRSGIILLTLEVDCLGFLEVENVLYAGGEYDGIQL